MKVYLGMYEVLNWPYWFDIFVLSLVVFLIIGIIIYSFYKDQKKAIENLKSQANCYVTQFHKEQNKSNILEKEVTRLREEIQELRKNESKEKNKEISW